MKIPLMNLMLCMSALARDGAGYVLERSAKEKKVQYASWDDVNVIAHGLLQLGHGLKEHVDKTKSQMRDVASKLKSVDGAVGELGRESQQLKQDSEALRAASQGLQEHLNVSNHLQEQTEQLRRDGQRVNERIVRLEEKVNGILQGQEGNNYSDAAIVPKMLEAQGRRIDALVERIRQQQEKLEKQNVRIRNLQSQVKQGNRKEVAANTSTEQSDAPYDIITDCHKLFLRGERTSGIYTIQPLHADPFQVFCQMTHEGGWTVIQRRSDGSLDFDQPWHVYRNGFGSLEGELWLGLEKMHAIAEQGDYVLQVELSDWSGESQTIVYSFSMSGEERDYTLYLRDGEPGSLESALSTDSAGLPFSTQDRDNDLRIDINCAKHLSGGWWFSNCGHSNLNGRYFSGPLPKQRHQRKQGIFWKTWRGRYYPLKSTLMKIAPAAVAHHS